MPPNRPWRALARVVHSRAAPTVLAIRATTVRSRVIVTSLGVGVGFGLIAVTRSHAAMAEADNKWPTISYDTLMKHTRRDSLWVSYKGSVYDVTAFVSLHPGTYRF